MTRLMALLDENGHVMHADSDHSLNGQSFVMSASEVRDA